MNVRKHIYLLIVFCSDAMLWAGEIFTVLASINMRHLKWKSVVPVLIFIIVLVHFQGQRLEDEDPEWYLSPELRRRNLEAAIKDMPIPRFVEWKGKITCQMRGFGQFNPQQNLSVDRSKKKHVTGRYTTNNNLPFMWWCTTAFTLCEMGARRKKAARQQTNRRCVNYVYRLAKDWECVCDGNFQ